MKNYIGTKLISAKPMGRAGYNTYRGWELPDNENGDDGGDDEYELHSGGVSSCAQSSSRTRQQTNFFADHGKNVNSDNSDKGDSNDGEEDNLDNATGDELNDDGDGNDAMDDDDNIIDLTVESEDVKVLQMHRVSK